MNFISAGYFPNLQFLLLQHNRIAGTSTAGSVILKMLQDHHQLHIAVAGNAVAALDGTAILFSSLIFIPEAHLGAARAWSNVFNINADLKKDDPPLAGGIRFGRNRSRAQTVLHISARALQKMNG
jgi:hypothetical protein